MTPIIITNDLDNWYKVSRNLGGILEKIGEERYTTTINKLQVISPKEYEEWRKTIAQ